MVASDFFLGFFAGFFSVSSAHRLPANTSRISAITARLHFTPYRIHASDVLIERTRFPAEVDGMPYIALTLKYTEPGNKSKQRFQAARVGNARGGASSGGPIHVMLCFLSA